MLVLTVLMVQPDHKAHKVMSALMVMTVLQAPKDQ